MEKFLRNLLAWLKRSHNRTQWQIAKAEGRVIYSQTSMTVYKIK